MCRIRAEKDGKMIRVVLFDFGGVIADEGFYQGLRAIAEESGLEPEQFLRTAEELIHRTGYVTGRATELHIGRL